MPKPPNINASRNSPKNPPIANNNREVTSQMMPPPISPVMPAPTPRPNTRFKVPPSAMAPKISSGHGIPVPVRCHC
jgi:hypothetical protein